MKKNLPHINSNTTLFIDRDGVINKEKHNDYIHTWNEFIWYDGTLNAFKIFAKKFKYIIVVTNQRGVAKGLTTIKNLQTIHQNMQSIIEANGGRITAIFFCTDMDAASPNRKPNIGMALQAKQQFADIDFNNCYMVGNTLSDMQFGKSIQATTIFLPTTKPEINQSHHLVDAVYPSLLAFALDI